MKRQFILEGWNKLAVAIPATAPPIQRVEMRRAFYAGFSACLNMSEFMSEGDSLDDPADHDIMRELMGELLAFGIAIKEGRA